MIEKITIYIQTPIKKCIGGLYIYVQKNPTEIRWVSIPSHFIIRQRPSSFID